MKIYTKKLTMLVIACVLFASGISCAKMKAVRSRRDFEQSVAQDSKVVALFYDEKDKGLTRMYEDVSKVQKYDDADIVFLRVNVARPELKDLAALYNVTAVPVVIFFHKGKRLVGRKNGAQIELSGKFSRSALESCIDKHYGAEMEQYIAKKNAKNDRRAAQENESWKVYYYPRDMIVPSYGPEERDLE